MCCQFSVGGVLVVYYLIEVVSDVGFGDFLRLFVLLKVVLENLLCFEDDGWMVSVDDIKVFVEWVDKGGQNLCEIVYCLVCVLMQDFIGVFVVVDLVVMCDGIKLLGGDVQKINLLNLVDLVIDYLVMIDEFGNFCVFQCNVELEYECNFECYIFLKWGQNVFNNFCVVLLGMGICYQVNFEYLVQIVWIDIDQDGYEVVYFDMLVGIDSYIIMVNGFVVFGWGVGGIEVEVVMLGQLIFMLIFEVVGFKIIGVLCEGVMVIDLVLKVVQMLCKYGVVGKFVEFYGEGLDYMFLVDCVIIVNMVLEYGVICGFFFIDDEILCYLCQIGWDEDCIVLVEVYVKENGFWCMWDYVLIYFLMLEFDQLIVVLVIFGLKCLQDYVVLIDVVFEFSKYISGMCNLFELMLILEKCWNVDGGVFEFEELFGYLDGYKFGNVEGQDYQFYDGLVVIVVIIFCINILNFYVLMVVGLVVCKVWVLGLMCKFWVKILLVLGLQVVVEYFEVVNL